MRLLDFAVGEDLVYILLLNYESFVAWAQRKLKKH